MKWFLYYHQSLRSVQGFRRSPVSLWSQGGERDRAETMGSLGGAILLQVPQPYRDALPVACPRELHGVFTR